MDPTSNVQDDGTIDPSSPPETPGPEPAEGRVDVSQPSDSASEQAKVDRQGSAARPTTRTDLDTDVPNEGFGIEPDEPDEELRDALRREPGR